MIRAVVFDVGETLVDETEIVGGWADWLGVPRHTFSAAFGAALARGEEYLAPFRVFKADFDLAEEDAKRDAAGQPYGFGVADLYPDVVPCIEALKVAGVWVGVAGNQPLRAERDLRGLGLPVDLIGTSAGWGVRKPQVEFFERVAAEAPCAAHEILYVGDRARNDVAPAQQAGLRAGFIRRGPWGFAAPDPQGEARADVRFTGLAEVPGWVAAQP